MKYFFFLALFKGPLGEFGQPLKRRCGQNRAKTCGCNQDDPGTGGGGGQSVTLGCSVSAATSGCKFGNSSSHQDVRKFRLKDKTWVSSSQCPTLSVLY